MTADGSESGVGTAATMMPTASGDGVTPSSDPELSQGATVGEYRIEGKLGEGGFGIVFRAVHPLIGKQVAIKVLNRSFSADPAMVSRFVAEAKAVNQIRHKNIIDIFSFGQLPDGRQYYIMELLSGMPLDGYLEERGGRLVPEVALPVLRAVARALDGAHAKGIAHRDLKPENVFIADDDGTPFPKLLDFGIAKLLSSDAPNKHKTRTGAPMGTPTYMSPEQCRGKDVDHRTDIYSFGIMTYQVLTGMLPFRGEDFVELLTQQVSGVAAPPSQVAPLPQTLDAPILHMMEKDPANRPASLTDAVDALYDAVGMEVPVRPAGGISTVQGLRAVGSPTPAPSRTPPPSSGQRANAAPASITAISAPRSNRKLVAVIAIGALVAVAVVVVVATRGNQNDAGSQVGSQVQRGSDPPPPVPDAATVATVDAAMTIDSPVATPTVEIEITGAPPNTFVYGPGRVLLGTVPGTLVFPRSEQPLEIKLEHPGYRTRTEKIAVTVSKTLSLSLTKVPAVRAGSGKGSSDIPDF